jgi:endonuclease/exonuclease/phosphatase family metal-dependent hydrolase
MRLTVATYNIHRCIGRDQALRPDRIIGVLQELRADVVALQEVETRDDGGLDLLAHFTEETGLAAIAGANMFRHGARYGNALLTRLPIVATARCDLSFPHREPRGAIEAELDWNGTPLHVVATHLGLSGPERRWQVKRLLERFQTAAGSSELLLGDINEWWRRGRAQRWLDAYFEGSPRALGTFPSWYPLLPLDQIRVRPRHLLRDVTVHASPLARRASDHLPLRARLELRDRRHGS